MNMTEANAVIMVKNSWKIIQKLLKHAAFNWFWEYILLYILKKKYYKKQFFI